MGPESNMPNFQNIIYSTSISIAEHVDIVIWYNIKTNSTR